MKNERQTNSLKIRSRRQLHNTAKIILTTINIETSWHKPNDSIAMTYDQLKFIEKLKAGKSIDWPFNSSTNAMRRLTKFDASAIIDALKENKTITFN